MRGLRRVLLAVVGALVVLLVLAAGATAVLPGRFADVSFPAAWVVMPAAVQTTSYEWAQPPAWVGQLRVVASGPQSTSYEWPQPPSWVPIAG